MRARTIALAMAVAGAGAFPAAAWAAGSHTVFINAVVLSKSICTFNTSNSTINLTIDPSGSTNASQTGTVVFRCVGSAPTASYGVTNNNGQWGSSPAALRMRHADTVTYPSEYMAYSLSYPLSGTTPKNSSTTLTVTATVSVANFQGAAVGTYADSVILTIAP
jgi:hypothetical protein